LKKGIIKYYSNVLLVGGSHRHVGKTTFVCNTIESLSKNFKIIGLKATSIRNVDYLMHGTHLKTLENDYEIFEEKDLSGIKDTSKMILSGAYKAFYLRSDDKLMKKAFNEFYSKVDKDCFIIAESMSLRYVLRPSLFILIKNFSDEILKPDFTKLEHLADKVLLSDKKSGFNNYPIIDIKSMSWMIH